MTAHEHAALCRQLRLSPWTEDRRAADAIDDLHARLAILESHLTLSTASDLYHGAVVGVGSVIAELSGSLSPPAVAALPVGSPAAGDSSPSTPDEPGQE